MATGKRSGRTRGLSLGQGGIAFASLTATKRVINIITGTTTGSTLQLTQGETLMATVDGVVAMVFGTSIDKATGSLEFTARVVAGGTIQLLEYTQTLQQNMRLSVYIVGRPDPLRLG